MSSGFPQRPVRAKRVRRRSQARRRQVGAMLGLLAVVGLVVFAISAVGGEEGAGSSPTTVVSGEVGTSTLVAFSVTGGAGALLAVIGSGGDRDPAAVILPPGTTVVAPGQSEATTEQVQALPGTSMRIAVSNAVGTWAEHFAVMELRNLGEIVDRSGGITVNLPDAASLGSAVLGPGEAEMSGTQVETFLFEQGPEAALRWQAVLDGVLAVGPTISATDLTETDDAEAVAALFAGAAGASARVLPTHVVAASVLVPDQPRWDGLVMRSFGTREPVATEVQNGSGSPGVGESVAARILPEGFRVALSGNAESFDHTTTEVVANGEPHTDDAEAVLRALGTGTIRVSPVASGIADVTIVVGKDFQG